jgi:hypothetical protein
LLFAGFLRRLLPDDFRGVLCFGVSRFRHGVGGIVLGLLEQGAELIQVQENGEAGPEQEQDKRAGDHQGDVP